MPNWSNTPPPQDKHMAFALVRTPPDRPLTAIVTSDDLIGCNTHYWGGRTVPCEAPDCRACAESMPFRWHAYMSIFDQKTRDHMLFECTARAALAFEQYRVAHGTLRGCHFLAVRPKRGRNSRVEIVTKPADLTKITLPQAPDLVRAMSVIWQIPHAALPKHTGLNGSPDLSTNAAVLKRMRGDNPSTVDPPTMGEILSNTNGHKHKKGTK